jgi:large subunit ribosomal protein L21
LLTFPPLKEISAHLWHKRPRDLFFQNSKIHKKMIGLSPRSIPKGQDMYAVIKTGGKQYKVAANDVITIERLAGEAGGQVVFNEVLLVGSESGVTVGTPVVDGASVAAELVEQARGPKVISFKKRRRQNSKRKKGHRQDLTVVRISEILLGGAKPAAVKKAAPVKAEAAAAESVAEGVDAPVKKAAKPRAKKATEGEASEA